MLNNDAVVRQSQRFAQRVIAEVGNDPAQQVARAWLLAYGQPATDVDVSDGAAFVAAQRAEFEYATTSKSLPTSTAKAKTPKAAEPAAAPATQALAALCQSLLCSNRFLYVD
jgi:hypothetical protein